MSQDTRRAAGSGRDRGALIEFMAPFPAIMTDAVATAKAL
jgi:hypothetical protein